MMRAVYDGGRDELDELLWSFPTRLLDPAAGLTVPIPMLDRIRRQANRFEYISETIFADLE